ncbi:DUF2497 domain-containing protein [Sphingomonas sp.]|uniref:DUF2497 domain-containing protein n=1 Tax=Sphingomonas sp. TaxID=28214 RepID=UPI003CC50201
MGDLSAEPSMEEILSSIKRIIAEEGDGTPARPRRQVRTLAATPVAASLPGLPQTSDEIDEAAGDGEVLELRDPMPAARPEPELRSPRPAVAAPEPAAVPVATSSIISEGAAAASRGALDSLSRMMIKPEPGSDGSLEGLVRDMLRPMLREWLDANLPDMVEAMVAKEIKRITGQPG